MASKFRAQANILEHFNKSEIDNTKVYQISVDGPRVNYLLTGNKVALFSPRQTRDFITRAIARVIIIREFEVKKGTLLTQQKRIPTFQHVLSK